jgi:SAM-dependent methyltransferase
MMSPRVRKKAYEAHEVAYRRMAREGMTTWNERLGQPAIDPDQLRFLRDAFAQPYVPRSGRVLEVGCGTAPMLRWIVKRGFEGMGVDVSRTAIALGRSLSRDVTLRVGDATRLRVASGSIDVVVDGNCLHCLVDDRDRVAFHREVARVLRPGGCFVLLTMARPIASRRRVGGRPGFVDGNVLYQPVPGARRYRRARRVGGGWHAPPRRFETASALLRMLRAHDLEPRLVRIVKSSAEEPVGHVAAVAVRGGPRR